MYTDNLGIVFSVRHLALVNPSVILGKVIGNNSPTEHTYISTGIKQLIFNKYIYIWAIKHENTFL